MCFWIWKKPNKQSLKIDPGTQKYILAIHNVFSETSVLYMIYQCIFQNFIKFQNFQNYKITFSKNFIFKKFHFQKISKFLKFKKIQNFIKFQNFQKFHKISKLKKKFKMIKFSKSFKNFKVFIKFQNFNI
jgi:hypothetical protein